MAKNTSILLSDHFDRFIRQKIDSGKYSSVSDVIRSALRLLEEEEQKLEDLRASLRAGEQSGIADDFDPAKHFSELQERYS